MTRIRLPLLALLCSSACSGGTPASTEDGSTAASTSAGTADGPPTATGDVTEASSATTDTGETSSATSDADGAVGCDGVPLLPVPEDTSLPGPWPVGARTAVVDGLTLEVWYPAQPGSEAGEAAVRYDIRTSLPDSEQGKVPDEANPGRTATCWRDLPIDADHGPYPVVVFIHGTAGFRSQSLEFMTHWASRGFVVVAADHPGLWLKDLLGLLCGAPAPSQDLGGDLDTIVAALADPQADLAFLQGRVDTARLAATAGHSAGGFAVEPTGAVRPGRHADGRSGGVAPGAALRSVLVLGAQSDQVVAYSAQQTGYADSPAPKRLVGLANAGHLDLLEPVLAAQQRRPGLPRARRGVRHLRGRLRRAPCSTATTPTSPTSRAGRSSSTSPAPRSRRPCIARQAGANFADLREQISPTSGSSSKD
jgi:hypothetical protein